MDLTPNDIRSYNFPSQLRGFDKDEVNNFKEQVAAALERTKQEVLKLSMELESVKGQLASLKQFEDSIKSAAIDARRNADATVSQAKQEAEKILDQARRQAEQTIAANSARLQVLAQQLAKFETTRNSYVDKMRSSIHSHLEIIEEILSDPASVEIDMTLTQADMDAVADTGALLTAPGAETPTATDENHLEVEESADVTTESRESIATAPSTNASIRTEEANSVAPEPEPEPEAEPEDDQPIDDEIAEALHLYQHHVASSKSEDSPRTSTQPAADDAAAADFVETTRRADEVPPEFIAVGEADDPAMPVDHQAINPDAAKGQAASPEDLSSALDDVVAKFEEELDKAAKE